MQGKGVQCNSPINLIIGQQMKEACYQFIKGPNNKISIVGFGSYGEVKLAKNTETGEIVAIKMIHGRNAKDQIDVHHMLNHPNIIHLLNYYYEKDKNVTYMVLEFAEAGSLHEKIKFGYGQLPKNKIKRYFKDVCKAINYLHSLKYMHRDIKPQNILITKDDHCKLCDFGFAAILEYRSTLCGTYEYMAPQMIQEKPYDYKVDIWALGILLFELIQGSAPFRGQTGQDVISEMKKPIVFSNRFEKEEIELIKMILRVGAEKRPTVSAILEHSFFKDVEDDTEPQKKVEVVRENLKVKDQKQSQGSRTGSSWSSQNQATVEPQKNEKSKFEKPSSQVSQPMKPSQKQFKYFVPQGVKSNTIGQNKPQNYTPMSSNMSQGPYQSYNSQFSSSNSNSSATNMNLNSSSSSAYRSNQTQQPSYVHNPKTTQINPTKGLASMQSPTNQSRPNVPVYNAYQVQGQTGQIGSSSSYQPSSGYVPGQWRKH